MGTPLIPRLECFSVCLAKGMTQAAAYKEAHPTSKASHESCKSLGTRLAGKPEVQRRVKELLIESDPESVITLTEHLQTLKTRSDSCWQGENKNLAERYDKQIGAWLARFKDAEREDKRIAGVSDVIAQLSHGDPTF